MAAAAARDRAERIPLRRLLVIRFGSLGDLVLLGWSLAGLSQLGEDRPRVTLVTKPVFADLMSAVPGVDEVAPLPGPRLRDLWRLSRDLRRRGCDGLVDAHANLRSLLLCRLSGRRPDARLAKDTAARLSLLFLRRRAPALDRTMRDRFDALFPALRGRPPSPPLARLASAGRGEGRLGIAPGARWDTKRWPAGLFADVLRGFRSATGGKVSLFLGPQEEAWFAASELARAARECGETTVWLNRPLREIAGGLAGCDALLTNDSGLLHLAEAVGTPVVALFGPTVREFGYFPVLPASRVVERALFCRPCSRNGRRPCFRGDQACLAHLPPREVLAAILDLPPWRRARKGEPAHG
jgi:heptosyltransferase-2